MKTLWQVRRAVVARGDGERRWDDAYQFLLQWAMAHETGTGPAPSLYEEEHPMNVALYARVSTTRQQQSQTIEQQISSSAGLCGHAARLAPGRGAYLSR